VLLDESLTNFFFFFFFLFLQGLEYFQVLVKIFQPVLLTDSQTHLKNFHAIVPALTLNFVDKMLLHKEKLGKVAGRYESAFTDDGFALGLAYILRILDQNDAFNSLHWFDSVNNHIATRRNEGARLRATVAANQRGAGGKGGSSGGNLSSSSKLAEEELAAHTLAMKKLSNVQTEFDLFFYSFSGATIFFQDVDQGGPSTGVEGQAKEAAPPAAEPGAPAAPGAPDANGVPPAPPAGDIPVPPPMDAGGFVSNSAAPPAPPMLAAADGMVVGVGAPPPPPPDF
jgi:WASH complex subunit 7